VVFETPHAIDVRATVDVATPQPWREALPGQDNVAVAGACATARDRRCRAGA
jgi:hypothetical protein